METLNKIMDMILLAEFSFAITIIILILSLIILNFLKCKNNLKKSYSNELHIAAKNENWAKFNIIEQEMLNDLGEEYRHTTNMIHALYIK